MRKSYKTLLLCLVVLISSTAQAQSAAPLLPAQPVTQRTLAGTVVAQRNELVTGATVIAQTASGEWRTVTDDEGRFRLDVPNEAVTLRVEGENIAPGERQFSPSEAAGDVEIKITYIIPPIHESIVIEDSTLAPSVDRRDEAVYRDTLFSRDDQVFNTLNAGINAGQHEGGGKSLEIRRFGYNLDHGGLNGGLKVLVDDVQQNQGTQGHGQGYLGQLKSLTPELIRDVNILNGPFSAQYGDFSGLGVVHVRLRESLPNPLTVRVQGGSFDTLRTFVAYSPKLEQANAFVAYEGSRTDGPFISPLRYRRDSVTANYTRRLDEHQSFGVKLNVARNNFFASGQIPLDEVAAGRLDRFGFIDPDLGGRSQSGTLGIYYSRELESGGSFKVDGFIGRSLFDLFSNFTTFLNDEVNGDEIQQHDSRLQQGLNAQYLHAYRLFGRQALFTAGASVHANQINVGLYQSVGRNPFAITTSAHARVNNYAGYVQHGIDLLSSRLHIEAGLRYDYFSFDVDDRVDADFSGRQAAFRFQPKFNVSYVVADSVPTTFHFNYGRGISSQDARGVVRDPSAPKVSTTDFYQLGASHNTRRLSVSVDAFLIDRSNEQVYIADDGSLEFAGASRTYGFEGKTSLQITRQLAFNGGITQVSNSFFRGTFPRVYVDSAPHTVANAAFTLSDFYGFTSSLRYRHTGNYRLDGEDATIRAAGLDVLDFSMAKRLRQWVDFNLSVDNLTNKRYFETQNYFESRLRPGDAAVERIHATPGYPLTVSLGFTLRLFGEK